MDIEQLQQKCNALELEQSTIKIMINSLYGAMANEFLVCANYDIAASVTSYGRFFIQYTAKLVNDEMQKLRKSDKSYVVYGDTDSLYISADSFIDTEMSDVELFEFLDSIITPKIYEIIEQSKADMALFFNTSHIDAIVMERELVMSHAVFTAMKKYYAQVLFDTVLHTGDNVKLKIAGMDSNKGGMPAFVANKLRECMLLAFDNSPDKIIEWRRRVYDEFKAAPLSEIASSLSVTRVDRYKDVGLPFTTKAALAHNEYVQKHLNGIVQPIEAGTRNSVIYLKTPNIFGADVIMYNSPVIERLILAEDIVDYDTTFNKLVNSSIKRICNFMTIPDGVSTSMLSTIDF